MDINIFLWNNICLFVKIFSWPHFSWTGHLFLYDAVHVHTCLGVLILTIQPIPTFVQSIPQHLLSIQLIIYIAKINNPFLFLRSNYLSLSTPTILSIIYLNIQIRFRKFIQISNHSYALTSICSLVMSKYHHSAMFHLVTNLRPKVCMIYLQLDTRSYI